MIRLLLLFPILCSFQAPGERPPEVEEPERPAGVTVRDEGAFDGYTLFSPLRSKSVFLVDLDGEVAHRWETEMGPGNSVYLLDDGSLLRCGRVEEGTGFHGGGIGGRVQQFAWDGTLLWDYVVADETKHAHHDIEPLPNGNVLIVVWERVGEAEAHALGRDPGVVSASGFWPDAVLEVKPVRPDGGEVVWAWHASDHLIQDFDDTLAGYGDVTAHPERVDINADHRDELPLSEEARREMEEQLERMRALGYIGGEDDEEEDDAGDDGGRGGPRDGGDWLHTNSVDHHPELDLILLSVRELDELWIIDHSTTTEEAAGSRGGRFGKGGDLLYRWGNPRTYGAGTHADQQLYVQHDAQWIPAGSPGAGNVLVFNNGQGRPGGDASTVDELVLPLTKDGFVCVEGEAFGPTEPAWSYPGVEDEPFYASFISGCQRLPNGNTLICSGPEGRLLEVTSEGSVVWEYWNEFGGEIGMGRGGPGRQGGGPGAGQGHGAPRGRPGAGRPEGPPADGGGRRGRGGGPTPVALFRATRIAPDHPGLAALGD